jgi:hypothetical protein
MKELRFLLIFISSAIFVGCACFGRATSTIMTDSKSNLCIEKGIDISEDNKFFWMPFLLVRMKPDLARLIIYVKAKGEVDSIKIDSIFQGNIAFSASNISVRNWGPKNINLQIEPPGFKRIILDSGITVTIKGTSFSKNGPCNIMEITRVSAKTKIKYYGFGLPD